MSAIAVAEPLARTSEGMKAGPIGLAVILILCIVCYFLFKSMSKHLKTVRETFPSDKPNSARGVEPAGAAHGPEIAAATSDEAAPVAAPPVADGDPSAEPPEASSTPREA